MSEQPKKPRGRPKMAVKFDLTNIELMAARGLTKEQVSLALGVSADTFTRREKEDPEIFAAYERGKAKGIEQVANALFSKAVNGDNTAMIFYLKARAGWRDTQAVEVSGKEGGPIEVKDVKTQLAQRLMKLGGGSDGHKEASGESDESAAS